MKYKPLAGPGQKYCPQCKQIKPITEFAGGWCRACTHLKSIWTSDGDDDLKREMLKQYGGKCHVCGEENAAALIMTPPSGDGTIKLARRLKKAGWPAGYYVICLNCHAKE
jgi:hypothetical protein